MSRLKPGAILALVFLIGLSPGCLSPVHAEVIHENPDRLTTQQPYDISGKLELQLWLMFDSIDGVVSSINTSDINASRLSLKDYEKNYLLFKDYLGRIGLSGPDYRRIVGQADLADAELRAMISDSECFYRTMSRFEEYQAGGDTLNATRTAVEVQKYVDRMNNSSRHLSDSASVISLMLQNNSVSTNQLDDRVDTLNEYMGHISGLSTLPRSLLGNANLTLNASQRNVSAGDIVKFTGLLESNGSAVEGGHVTLYVDNVPAGNGTTSGNGICVIFYTVRGGSFADIMNAVGYFDPGTLDFAPAVSKSIELHRQHVPTELSISISPDNARFGDTVLVQGRLTADGDYPVPDHPVSVILPGRPAYHATTLGDGSYTCKVDITPRIRAGDLNVISMYGAAAFPGEALSNATSPNGTLRVLQDATSLTLYHLPSGLTGGEKVMFAGALTVDSGRPVNGGAIEIFAGDVLIGRNITTDDAGRYNALLTVPLSLAPGQYDIYAVYAPDAGMSITGSQSNVYTVDIRPAKPEITVTGMPLIAFRGDRVNLAGTVTVPRGPGIEGMTLAVSVPGMTPCQVVTGAGGSFSLSFTTDLPSGIQPVTIVNEPDNLLLSVSSETWSICVLPFDLMTGTVIVAIVLLVIGLVLSRMTPVRRLLTRAHRPGQKPLPEPQPAPPQESAGMPSLFRFEDELARIEAFVSRGADRREIIAKIYLASRRIAGDHGFEVPDSATHREFFKGLTMREPSLLVSTNTIARNYESAVFGQVLPGEQDIASSLDSLREINYRMSGRKTGGDA